VGGGLCGGFESKYYLAHVNTPNVCRDFELMRNLTGWPTFDYWGFSYGTEIGTMYAQMFPARVGKLVLDGILLPLETGADLQALSITRKHIRPT
jgi:pimeloyl-ACP methyl ester carboxylesterase